MADVARRFDRAKPARGKLTVFRGRRYHQRRRSRRQVGDGMGPLGFPEMIFIFVVALVVFGPKQLPELGKKLGKGMSEFRKASTELKSTFQREMDNIERETRMQDVRQAASDIKSDIEKDLSPSALLKGDDEFYDEYDQHDSPPAKTASAARSDTVAEKPSVATSTENSSTVDSGAEKGAA